MLEAVLPPGIRWHESFGDVPGVLPLPEEEFVVARAVPRRRAEFATARWCARQALTPFGYGDVPILPGPKREPLWPKGIVGSMTHCDGYRAAAVASDDVVISMGIDAEPDQPVPDRVLNSVALPGEQAVIYGLLRDRPVVAWDRLLFSAKESVYKAWFPITGRWLGFEEAHVTFGDGVFSARILIDSPLPVFEGRWAAEGGLIVTSVVVQA
ncbi:4'-phosphopantetheinyl transferase family protein [Herbidospora mongoliensis]|uniref:4'-phosphopantetheinyl transferase family protein n=1 Tax=Herbidospora mongoliensis TaxID=688067 RepID=UPI00082EC45C|nr:4'-phosphopantetheinyl transferase superfamily protein [Herbidospora mongoliensis]